MLAMKRQVLESNRYLLIAQCKLDESTRLGYIVKEFPYCEDRAGLIAIGLKPSTFVPGDSEVLPNISDYFPKLLQL